MRTVVLASLRSHARRYVAAVLAVVISVGFIVAVNAISAAARDGVRASVGAEYAGADVVASGGEPAALESVATTAGSVDAVETTAVNRRAFTDVTIGSETTKTSVGTLASAPRLRWQELESGRYPRTSDEALVSGSRAEQYGVGAGDRITVRGPDGTQAYTVSGVVADSSGSLGSSVYLPEEAMGEHLGSLAAPASVVVATGTGAAADVVERLDAKGGVSVQRAGSYIDDLQEQATNGIDIYQRLIHVFAGISLFVGALVIANTFTIVLAQRARDFALLRCVGSRRGQVLRSVVVEASAIAALGAVVGVAFGYAVAYAGTALLDRFLPQIGMGSPQPDAMDIAVPVALGVVVTVLASLLPARRITRLPPLAALAPQAPVIGTTRAGRVRIVVATALVVIGAVLLIVGLGRSLPVGMAGGMISFVGVVLLGPVLVPAAIRMLGPLARAGGVPGRMAVANAVRNPRRTASTSTALLVGVTLITAVVVGVSSTRASVETFLDEENPVDVTLTGDAGNVAPGMVDQVRGVDGVSAVAELPGTMVRGAGQRFPVAGVEAEDSAAVHGDGWFTRIDADTIVLPSDGRGFPDVDGGDTVRVRAGGAVQELTVRHAKGIGSTALVSESVLDELATSDAGTGTVWAKAALGANARNVSEDVAGLALGAGVDVGGGLSTRAQAAQALNVVLAVMVGLLGVAVLIALVGVGNTLSLSVLERIRENSLLRALGLERSRLRLMLAAEALVMALVAALLGVGLGAAYAWFGVRTVTAEVLGEPGALAVPWWQIGGIVAVAAGAGLLACVLPGRRAARIAPAAGLSAQ